MMTEAALYDRRVRSVGGLPSRSCRRCGANLVIGVAGFFVTFVMYARQIDSPLVCGPTARSLWTGVLAVGVLMALLVNLLARGRHR